MKTEPFAMRLSKEEKVLLEEQAKKEGRSMAQQIIWLLKRRQSELA